MAWSTSLHSGWVAKQELASSITNPAIDQAHRTATACGMRAGKVSGAGGGGFMMMMVDPVRRMDVIRGLTDARRARVDLPLHRRGSGSVAGLVTPP